MSHLRRQAMNLKTVNMFESSRQKIIILQIKSNEKINLRVEQFWQQPTLL